MNIICSTDLEALNTEWQCLSELNEFEKKSLENVDVCTFWSKILKKRNELKELQFPLLRKLVSAMLSIPHANTSVERVFSRLLDMKSKKRNTLGVDTCNAFMASWGWLNHNNCVTWEPPVNLIKHLCSKVTI